MHRILLVIAALTAGLLAGCAATSNPLESAPAAGGTGLQINATATLATTPCEITTASAVTAIANARYTAARKLQTGQFTVAQAQQVQALADKARSTLSLACVNNQVYVPGLTLLTLDIVNLRHTLESYK